MNRQDKAEELFKSGYNCAQSTIGAYCDLFGLDFETAMKITEGLGGGMGRLRLTCGAVTSMFILAGMKKSKAQAADLETRAEVYGMVQAMAKDFKELHGTVICGELLGDMLPSDGGSVPTKRDDEFYSKRPCVKCIRGCGAIIEKYLCREARAVVRRNA